MWRRSNSVSPRNSVSPPRDGKGGREEVDPEMDPETKKKMMKPISPSALRKKAEQGQLVSWTMRLLPAVVLAYGLVFAVAVVFQQAHTSSEALSSPSRFLTAFTQELQAAPRDPSSYVLPNVMMIGAAHAGVAELSEWLFENGFCHAAVHGDEPLRFNRGVPFFDNAERYQQGLDYYSDRYEHCKNKPFIMDASPNTLPHPDHVEAIYKQAGGDHLKNLKVMAILREPVSREMSLYNHKRFSYEKTGLHNQWYSDVALKDGTVHEFYEHVDTIINDLVNGQSEWGAANMGFYAEHLKKWFSLVNRTNFMVISYDEYSQNKTTVDQRVRDFLGQDFKGSSKGVFDDPGNPSCGAEERLNNFFIPMNKELYTLLEVNPGPASEQVPFPEFVQLECDCPKNGTAPQEGPLSPDALIGDASILEEEVDALTTEEQRRQLGSLDKQDFSNVIGGDRALYTGDWNENAGSSWNCGGCGGHNGWAGDCAGCRPAGWTGGGSGDSTSGGTTSDGTSLTSSGSTGDAEYDPCATTSGGGYTTASGGAAPADDGGGGAESDAAAADGGGSPAVESSTSTGDLSAPTTRGCRL